MTAAEKEFVLSHVFNDVSGMKDDVLYYSPIEDHFGVPWKIAVQRTTGHLGVYLFCTQEKIGNEWSIEVSQEGKTTAKNGKTNSTAGEFIFKSTCKFTGWGWIKFIKWEDLMNDYVIDDSVTVEFRVKIRKMTGIVFRNFDESTKELSDVVLVVEDKKFYVSKLFLAGLSPIFKSTLLKLSESEGLPEHTLKDVKAVDFQKFLELLYGESSINESTVSGIAHLANLYGVTTALQKCEQFLMESSKKSLKEKLQLAHRCNLKNLKDDCLSNISTVAQIRSVLTEDLREMDPLVSGALLQKFLALYEKSQSESVRLPEPTLKDVKAADVQKSLDLLEGFSLSESNIERILHSANAYETTGPIQKCEQFLIENSKKSLKEKLQLAHRYKLEKLKNHCLSKISWPWHILEVVNGNLDEMDPSVVRAVLLKLWDHHAWAISLLITMCLVIFIVLLVLFLSKVSNGA